jgi:hypothetical protein
MAAPSHPQENADELKGQPVPAIARKYYEEDNPFLFDLMYTSTPPTTGKEGGRPKLESLYDVFVCVRDDEKGHWVTLCNLVQSGSITSATGGAAQATLPTELEEGALTLPWLAAAAPAPKPSAPASTAKDETSERVPQRK